METITLACDRCTAQQTGAIADLVDEQYLVDDPTTHTGALCPRCAYVSDPLLASWSWLLVWEGGY